MKRLIFDKKYQIEPKNFEQKFYKITLLKIMQFCEEIQKGTHNAI
jgi:hypothetical protein